MACAPVASCLPTYLRMSVLKRSESASTARFSATPDTIHTRRPKTDANR